MASRRKTTSRTLRVPAIRVTQSPGRTLYSFAIDGKLLHQIVTVSRIHRDEAEEIAGYQRPEVISHITEIRSYIESNSPLVPNAIVVAFDTRVRFVQAKSTKSEVEYADVGTIIIPIDDTWTNETKPGFIVDGQQRLAAIRDAALDTFPICVTAFITDDVTEQTEQFLLVNSTKPLPKGLIYELLPTTDVRLPAPLHRRRFASVLLDHLNHDERSPLKGLIRTPTNPAGMIKDNSILKMLENSLSNGVLHHYRYPDTIAGDVDAMLEVLFAFWGALSKVFEEAWGLPPKQSRLMHGAGIVSMGFVMDEIATRHHKKRTLTERLFYKDLKPLKAACHWTEGSWDFPSVGKRKWYEIQNTTKDIQHVTNYLVAQYKSIVRAQGGKAAAHSGPQQKLKF